MVMAGFSSKFGKFSINKILNVAVGFVSLQYISTAISGLTGVPAIVRSLTSIGLSLAQLGLVAKFAKSMPFGIGSIVTTLVGLNATIMVLRQLPNIFAYFVGSGQPTPVPGGDQSNPQPDMGFLLTGAVSTYPGWIQQ